MERYYGFDLGDAESAVSTLAAGEKEPEVLSISGAKSFITAYAQLRNGDLIIGESACYTPDAQTRRLRFKSRFLTRQESEKDLRAFAGGVLGELYGSGNLVKNADTCFYVGCPAGWDRNARERYRRIFEGLGYPPTKIVSESRAALISACRSKHLQVGYDILSQPVLVVDIGSSTTDFAFISGGRETELKTAGEVALGGGLMDEFLLDMNLENLKKEDPKTAAKLFRIFLENDPWRTYAEFAARRLKEKYFSDETYWETAECMETVTIVGDEVLRFPLRIDRGIAEALTENTMRTLGRSFHAVFSESLLEIRDHLAGDLPTLIFLTGGVSKLTRIQDWCRSAFPDAVIITSTAPEFSVAKGLAWTAETDAELQEFVKEVSDLKDSSIIERLVSERIDDLYERAVQYMTEPILTAAVLPVLDRWRAGEIRRLADIDGELEKAITAYLHTDAARTLLAEPVKAWLKPIAYALEEYTMPICARHHVPFRMFDLNSYLSVSADDFTIDAKGVFAVREITYLVDTIISIIIGLLCGGSGIAFISSGLPGIITGAAVSLIVLALGKEQMQEALLQMNIPRPMRRLIPKGYFRSRLSRMSSEVKQKFRENLAAGGTVETSERMASDIADQIETTLMKMAEVVELPLA